MRKNAAESLRDRLQDTVRNCIVLNERLENVLHIPQQHLPGEIRHGKVSAAPVPWYTTAAFLITDLSAETRRTERELREDAGQPVRYRGGSNLNTYKSLESIVAISWIVDDEPVKECTRWMDKWCGRARIALGEMDEPRQLPRQPGQKAPSCPFCLERTLRFWALSGMVRCINPACFIDIEEQDPKKKRKPSARMEFSNVAGEVILVWNDNSVGVSV